MDNLILAGKLGKLHGLKAYISLHLNCEVDWDNIKTLFIEIDGNPVPYLMEDIKFLPQKTIVKFKNLSDINALKTMINNNVYIEEKFILNKESENIYKDFTVVDVHNNLLEIGTVEDTVIYMNAEWLVLKNKYQKEILLPIAQDLIERIDFMNKIIFYKAIDGMY